MKGIQNRQNTLLGRKLFSFTNKPDLSNKQNKINFTHNNKFQNFFKHKQHNKNDPSQIIVSSNKKHK